MVTIKELEKLHENKSQEQLLKEIDEKTVEFNSAARAFLDAIKVPKEGEKDDSFKATKKVFRLKDKELKSLYNVLLRSR